MELKVFKIIGDWIKVWWHTLVHFFKCDFNPPHFMCSTSSRVLPWGKLVRKDFCSCGYNNNGVTWDEELDKFLNQ